MAAVKGPCSRLPSMEADELKADTSHLLKHLCPHSKSNIYKGEYKAIRELREDQRRVVLTAHKGVVMDKQDYMNKTPKLLTGTSTYKTISNDPTARLRNRLVSTLKDIKQQCGPGDTTYRKLYPTSAVPQGLWQNPQNRQPPQTHSVQ